MPYQKGLLAGALKGKAFKYYNLLASNPTHNRIYRALQSYAHVYKVFYQMSKADMDRMGPSEVNRLFNEHQAGNTAVEDDINDGESDTTGDGSLSNVSDGEEDDDSDEDDGM